MEDDTLVVDDMIDEKGLDQEVLVVGCMVVEEEVVGNEVVDETVLIEEVMDEKVEVERVDVVFEDHQDVYE